MNWRLLFKRGMLGTFAGGSSYVVGAGIYGTKQINGTRQSWFSDDFVMTPETLRMPYKSVNFHTSDGIKLDGWFVEQTNRGRPSQKLILCCNPYNQDKSTLLGICRGFWDAGYSVLLFNYRSHAKPPQPRTIGYKEVIDAKAALTWLLENKPKDGKIGLVGASMGGAVALRLCAEVDSNSFDISKFTSDKREACSGSSEKIVVKDKAVPEDRKNENIIVACATDCAFSSLKRVLGASIDSNFPTRGFLFSQNGFLPLHSLMLESVCFINKFWYGYDPSQVGNSRICTFVTFILNGQVGPESKLADLKTPLFILHSENDTVVPVESARIIYEKSGTNVKDKEIKIIPNTEHIGAYFDDEKYYIRSIVNFLDSRFEQVQRKLGKVGE